MAEPTIFERCDFRDRMEAEQIARQFRIDGWDAVVLRERDGSFTIRAFPPGSGPHDPASNEGVEPAGREPPPLDDGPGAGATPPAGPADGAGPAQPSDPAEPAGPAEPTVPATGEISPAVSPGDSSAPVGGAPTVSPMPPVNPGPPPTAPTKSAPTKPAPTKPTPTNPSVAGPVVLLPSTTAPPRGVKALLDFIAQFESAGNYNARFAAAGNQDPRFTEMTLRDVLDWQRDFVQRKGSPSSAVGRYQIIRKTLQTLIDGLNLDPPTLRFDEQVQDRLATKLLEGRGLKKYLSGELSPEGFANSVSREWAALPIVTDDFRDHQGRAGRRGFSFYADVGNNKAHAGVESYLRAVRAVRA